ncbi:MAG: hypothetical protein AAGI10_07930 [Pseudomonadota bacterium]
MLTLVATSADGLELERALFDSEDLQIGFWSSRAPGLVCPRAYESRAGFAQALERSAGRGWPLALRPTGGGTVPQGPGIDNIAVAFHPAEGATITSVYRDLTEALRAGLGPDGAALLPGDTPGSFCDGTWNLSYGGQKIVGTAQRWRPRKGKKPRVLAHAVIVTRRGFEDGAHAVARFHEDLGLPPIQPEAHTSLEDALEMPVLPIAELDSALRAHFPA